jgi:general secretion pathway protein C
MPSRLSAFVIWALVAAAAVFWGLRLMVSPAAAPAGALAVDQSVSMGSDLTRLFGAAPVANTEVAAAVPANSRFKLIGVMAGRTTAEGTAPGIALIAIDDKPPRPFVAGARIEEQLFLKTVSPRTASLGPADGPATILLEVPPLPQPATGTLAPAPAGIEPGGDQSGGLPPPGPQGEPQFSPRPPGMPG